MGLKYLLFCVLLQGVRVQSYSSAFDTELYQSVLDSAKCEEQLNLLGNDSLRLKFVDASAKLPSGLQSGNVNDLGDYWQCLGIDELVNNVQIQGKYCTIIAPLNQNPFIIPDLPDLPDVTLPEIPWPRPEGETNGTEEEEVVDRYNALRRNALGMSGFAEPSENRVFPLVITSTLGATLGVCVPRPCTTRQALDFFQQQVPFFNLTYADYYCRLPNDKPISPADYTAMGIFGFIGLLLVLSTSYDLYCTFVLQDPKSANVMYRSFSVYTNTRRFLTFNSVPGAIDCIDGIRAISMMWVVVGHTYSFTLLTFVHNLGDTVTWLSKFSSTWINSAPITVDTFFALSGILAVYTTIGKISKGRFMRTIHLFYLNRLLRMFPLLATVVLLQASVFNHVSDGPFWVNVAWQTELCRQWWWSALLHVQNYVNTLEICIVQTWYLSVDMQLYIFSPLILVWLFGHQLFAWLALVSIVLLSLVSTSVYSFLNNFSAALTNPERLSEFNDYLILYYMNTLTRASPFFVGMVYGYLLHLYRNKRIRIHRLSVILLWALSFAMMAFCVFSIYPVMQAGHENQLFDNFLNSYMRAIWACGLGWLIFACVQGYGGPVNWFLSLALWKLPARLSFAMYLLHVSIILIANGSWVKTYYFTDGNNLYRFMSDFSLTFIAAFILCVTIDAPFSTLQKLLLGGGKRRPPKAKIEESRPNNIIEDEPQIIKTSL